MLDSLCRWLNDELRLSQTVEPRNFAKYFSDGYLFGEILHKYQMLEDFNMFLKKGTSIAKVNNFSRLRPSLKLLGVSYNINIAQDVMKEKLDVVTNLLYQLYVALKGKKSPGGGRAAMQPIARVQLHKEEHGSSSIVRTLNRCRLPPLVKPSADQNLPKIAQHCTDQGRQVKQKKQIKIPELKTMEKVRKMSQVCHQRHDDSTEDPTELLMKSSFSLNLSRKIKQQQLKEMKMVQAEIAKFEEKQRKPVTSGFASLPSDQPTHVDTSLWAIKHGSGVSESNNELMLQSNKEYIQRIRQRMKEDAVTQKERQKRVDRFLVEQGKALQAQLEEQFDEQLVRCMTRQSQREKCLVKYLMQIRREKEVIIENRRFRDQQYQQQREKDFQEALVRKAVLAQCAKLAREEEIQKELELCKRMGAERVESRHREHFAICLNVLGEMVDLATTVGEYHMLTGNVPTDKKNKEWKELFLRGIPFYEPRNPSQPEPGFSVSLDSLQLKKLEVLNNLDYEEYINMVGEWLWPKDGHGPKLPPGPNNTLAHVVHQLQTLAHPPIVESSASSFPRFRIKACILGKFCSGKTTCLAKIAEALGVRVLSTNTLIEEALKPFKDGEEVTNQQDETSDEQLYITSTSVLGAADLKEMRKGNAVPNELIVKILVKAISQVPAQSGWILDGFPNNVTQARMLEKALGGTVDEEEDFVNNTAEPDAYPYLSKPPPAPTSPVLDLALLLDIPDECVVRRAHSHGDPDAATASQEEEDVMYRAQIPHRIAAFSDAWPEVEAWFGDEQNILICLNADVEEEELYRSVESVLQQVIERQDEEHPANLSPSSVSNAASDEGNMVRPESGSESPLYVNEPLLPDVAVKLYSDWYQGCQSYANNIKQVMQRLRLQLSLIDHHLFAIRKRFNHFLGRPDLRQMLILQWQKDFNSIPDDMREDEETKEELHLRMDKLQECLLDLIDKRREEDEQEKKAVMCPQWVEMQVTCLVNNHSMIIQEELSRFHKTLCTLKVYYGSMQRQEPLTLVPKFDKISLLKIPKYQKATCPKSKNEASMMEDQFPSKLIKSFQMKFYNDHMQALQAISQMVSAAETEKKEKPSSAVKPKKKKRPPKKQTGIMFNNLQQSYMTFSSGPEDKLKEPPETTENTHEQEMREKIRKEYKTAQTHEEKSVKVRLELVKAHGLMMIDSLLSKLQETFSIMEKGLQDRYLSERKCMDQLSELVRYHIEAGAKLQYELVLEDCEFYLNGDYKLYPDPPPPPHPAPVEKPNRFIMTVTQLESLHYHLSHIAPSGLMSSFDFIAFLEDLVYNSLRRNRVPEAWTDMNQTQLSEMVALLTDEYELIDWRRFLLSAALPWPLPSLTQLLDLLQKFKEADADNTGYINEGQYLQTELWFSSESDQDVPQDPSEPLPYNRLADLRKFFFQLFADPSSSPPRLNYVSMLKYFAADPDPRKGFIRALSVVLGQHIQQPSKSFLIKPLPSTDETPELPSFTFTEDYKEEEGLLSSSSLLKDQEVPISVFLDVTCHKVTKMEGSTPLPPGCLSQEEHKLNLEKAFSELGYQPDEPVPFSIISQHPYIDTMIETSTHFQLVNLLNAAGPSG
ncbi:PREDICTED: sperm flagellar protein 2 [Cyprinodon variegatus]|uniref:sperm flagellar protein 2 n=1 Tax=Cyprinodon variegatus TaxID=28743 RepID=UPI0007426206|nr:PREDICTED: sperm flagellar protein 2 [Cyprinodon variegatus]